MKPLRQKTTAAAIINYLRDGGWRSPSEIERGADLAWYSPLVLVLIELEHDGILESRWKPLSTPPRSRQYHLKTVNEPMKEIT